MPTWLIFTDPITFYKMTYEILLLLDHMYYQFLDLSDHMLHQLER